MFAGAIDIRRQLQRNPSGGPNWRVALQEKTGLVVHYNGGPVPAIVPDQEWLRRVAGWHVTRDWSNPATSALPIYGDGVMYHLGIGRDGALYRMRDLEDVLWHCGSWPENRTHVSVYVVLGGEQRATTAQLATLQSVADAWIESSQLRQREAVIGHQEVDWTACPGTLQQDFVLRFREVVEVTVNGKWFPETRCYVGGAFWQYWTSNGGLMIFGFPLSDERDEFDPESGQLITVQYFERAVFEWHPENAPAYRVLLRRLGAQALERDRLARATISS